MARDTDKKRPVILTDYYLRLPIQNTKRDIPSTIFICSFLISAASIFVIIFFFDSNKIAGLTFFSIFILSGIFAAIFSKLGDSIGEVNIDKQQITIKLDANTPRTFQLSDITLKLRYHSYDGKNNFPSRVPNNGFGNIIEINSAGDKYSYQVYFTIHDVRTLNLYADIWDQNHYDYKFTNSWGIKVKRLAK